MVVAGGTIYAAGRDPRFGYQGLRALPLSNAVVGFSVFSTAEAVGEPVTGAPNGTFTTAVISDGANGWYLAGGYPRFVVHMRADGTIDPAFQVQLTNDIGPGSIRALALKDSRVVIGGEFTAVNGVPRLHAAVLDAGTGAPLSVNPVVAGPVDVLAITGSMVLAGGEALSGFDLDTGASVGAWTATVGAGRVSAIVADNTHVYVGGSFTDLGGTGLSKLVRLDRATGSVDPGWNPGTDGVVRALVRVGGGLFVGGTFLTVGGQPRHSLAEVDASSGVTTPWRADANDDVFALAATDSTIYAGGVFTSIAGRPRRGLAAINAAAPAVVTSWAPDAGPTVLAVAATAAHVAVAGDIVGWGLREEQGVLAIDMLTGAIRPFAPRIREVEAMLLIGHRLILGGAFTSADGVPRTRLAAYDLDSGRLDPLDVQIDGPVLALAALGPYLVIGGQFTTVNGTPHGNLAAIDIETSLVVPWDVHALGGAVHALATWRDRVVVGGAFTQLAGTNGLQQRRSLGIATVAGAVVSFDAELSAGTFDYVSAVEVSGNSLYAGGSFSSARSQPRGNGAAYDLQTSALLPWDPAVSIAGPILSVSTWGGATYIGGSFFFFPGGAARPGVARVDAVTGALASWSPVGPWLPVRAVAATAAGVVVSSDREGLFYFAENVASGPAGPPVQPQARVVGSTVAVSWQPPLIGPRPDGYVVEAGTAPGRSDLGIFAAPAPPLVATGVPPGTYQLRVRAGNAAGTGVASPSVTVTVGAGTCTAAPAAPGMPEVTVTGSTVDVSWQPGPGIVATRFVLEAGTAFGRADIGAFATASLTRFTVSGVPAGAYFVRVIGENGCGRGTPSADAVVRVGGVMEPPATPLLLSATSSGGVVRITWLPSAAGGAATGHVLEAGSGPALFDLAALTLGAETTVTATGVPPGTYYLRLRAVNPGGTSAPTGDITLVVP